MTLTLNGSEVDSREGDSGETIIVMQQQGAFGTEYESVRLNGLAALVADGDARQLR